MLIHLTEERVAGVLFDGFKVINEVSLASQARCKALFSMKRIAEGHPMWREETSVNRLSRRVK